VDRGSVLPAYFMEEEVGTAKESSQTIDNRAYHQGRLDGEKIKLSQQGEVSCQS
jgi:hypothetical protein